MIVEHLIWDRQRRISLYLKLLASILLLTSICSLAGCTSNINDKNLDIKQSKRISKDNAEIYSDAVDTDGDGLSDFQEINKYFTNPSKLDSDGDNIPDSDWNERREYTYSVRSIIQFMPPFDEDALNRYREIIQAMRQRNIEPLVCLHHFTNPLWLVEKGDFGFP